MTTQTNPGGYRGRRLTVWALWQGGYIRKLEAADTPAYLSSYVITELGLRAARPVANSGSALYSKA